MLGLLPSLLTQLQLVPDEYLHAAMTTALEGNLVQDL